jgi:hypothetical protein
MGYMHDENTVQRFIELRAQGWTYPTLPSRKRDFGKEMVKKRESPTVGFPLGFPRFSGQSW